MVFFFCTRLALESSHCLQLTDFSFHYEVCCFCPLFEVAVLLLLLFTIYCSSQEKAILEVRAAVYTYDQKISNWAPKDGGESRVFVFHHPSTNAYRVIGQSLRDKQVAVLSLSSPTLMSDRLNLVQY